MTTVEELHRHFPAFHKATLNSLQNRDEPLDDVELATRIAAQQRALNEAAGALAAYDVRRYQSTLDELNRLLADRRAEAKPKTKFSFRSRRSEAPKVLNTAKIQQSGDVLVLPVMPEPPGSLTIRGNGAQIKQVDVGTHPDLLHNYTITIDSFTDSVLDLSRSEPYTSVTLRNLVRCTVKAGTSTSALYIVSCESCQLSGEAQQCRIHDCTACEVRYVCRTGRPVIEDCEKMMFGNEMTSDAGQRNITAVDDFSDLSGDGRNWSIIDGFTSG